MDTAAYEEMVREMCEYVGLQYWRQVVSSRHLMIGDVVVGLIYDEEADAGHLHIYVELGPTYPARDSSLYKRMLAANLERQAWLPGHLGLDPHTDQGVYHVRVDLRTPREGKWLAEFLASQAEAASMLFKELHSDLA